MYIILQIPLLATKYMIVGSRVLRGCFLIITKHFTATKYKNYDDIYTSWQEAEICSIFYKNQTNFPYEILPADAWMGVFGK